MGRLGLPNLEQLGMNHTGSVVGGVVNEDPVYVIAVLVEVLHFLVPARPHVQRHSHP